MESNNTLSQQEQTAAETEKQQLKQICTIIANLKKEIERVQQIKKQFNEQLKPHQDNLLQFMIERQIPSIDNDGVIFNVTKPRKKSNPSSSHVLKATEALVGKPVLEKIKEASKQLALADPKTKKKATYRLQVLPSSTKQVFEE